MSATIPDNYVYLDYAASAPLCKEAARAMEPFMQSGPKLVCAFANPNSLHSPGRAAFQALEASRRRCCELLELSRPDELVFTSGATEANNAALIGLTFAARQTRMQKHELRGNPRIVVSSLEHDSVLQPAKLLQSFNIDVEFLPPDSCGFIDLQKLERVMDENTLLVSVQSANGEIGTVQDIASLCEISHAYGALFHTDAVQALGKTPLHLKEWAVDAASFSAHKIGGPKGAGLLYLRSSVPFSPLLRGGGQEATYRSGTQNVSGAVGFAAAMEQALKYEEAQSSRLREIRDLLVERIESMPGIRPTLHIPPASRLHLPNIVHALADNLDSETMLLRLDALGFGVSGGSACSSRSLEPSHVLKAIGVQSKLIHNALRISFGRYTSKEEIVSLCEALLSLLR